MGTSIWTGLAFTALAISALGCEGSSPGPATPPLTTPTAAQGPEPVVVTNTTADPVPTAAVGTTTVAGNVGVSGTVAATQSGAWSVSAAQSGPWSVAQTGAWNVGASQAGSWTVDVASAPPVTLAAGASVEVSALPPVELAGTPSVSISGTPTVALAALPPVSGSVSVNNPVTAPVPVRSVQTQTPWSVTVNASVNNNNTEGVANLPAVPAGKRLVIELAGGWCEGPQGMGGVHAFIFDSNGASFEFPLSYVYTTVTSRDRYVATQVMKGLYAEAGATLLAGIARGGLGSISCRINVGGYLIDA